MCCRKAICALSKAELRQWYQFVFNDTAEGPRVLGSRQRDRGREGERERARAWRLIRPVTNSPTVARNLQFRLTRTTLKMASHCSDSLLYCVCSAPFPYHSFIPQPSETMRKLSRIYMYIYIYIYLYIHIYTRTHTHTHKHTHTHVYISYPSPIVSPARSSRVSLKTNEPLAPSPHLCDPIFSPLLPPTTLKPLSCGPAHPASHSLLSIALNKSSSFSSSSLCSPSLSLAAGSR